MRNLVLVVILMIGLGSLQKGYGQEVIYSQYEKFDIRNGDYSVAGKVGDLLYVYRGGSDGYYLDAYNNNMERVATVVLDFIQGRVYETKFYTYADHMILLYQVLDGARLTQYAVLLDEKARLVKRPIALDNTKIGLFGGSKKTFNYAISDDKKKLVVYGVYGGGRNLEAKFIWMDDQLNITGRNAASYTAENDVEYGEGLLYNDGTLYLPAYTPVGSRNYADQLWLLMLKQDMRKFTPVEVALNEQYAAGTYMKLDADKERIYVGGFYSDKKNGNYEGVLYTYYDIKTGSFQPTRLMPFDDRMRNATGGSSKKRAFNDHQVRQLIVKSDGGFLLISEDYFVTTRNSYSPGFGYYSFYYPTMGATVREYHYNDIMVLSYDPTGQMEWNTFIRKDQYSQEDGGMFSSYALINTGGAIGFLFNDFNTSRSRVQLATMDASGRTDIHSLAPGDGQDADWLPRSAKQIAAREIIVPCLRKRQICFAKIVF